MITHIHAVPPTIFQPQKLHRRLSGSSCQQKIQDYENMTLHCKRVGGALNTPTKKNSTSLDPHQGNFKFWSWGKRVDGTQLDINQTLLEERSPETDQNTMSLPPFLSIPYKTATPWHPNLSTDILWNSPWATEGWDNVVGEMLNTLNPQTGLPHIIAC